MKIETQTNVNVHKPWTRNEQAWGTWEEMLGTNKIREKNKLGEKKAL